MARLNGFYIEHCIPIIGKKSVSMLIFIKRYRLLHEADVMLGDRE